MLQDFLDRAKAAFQPRRRRSLAAAHGRRQGQRESCSKLPAGTTPADLAAWTALARVVLNLDETITKE